jgi:hypothetical protein
VALPDCPYFASIAKKIPSMLKKLHRRKNNPIDGEKNPSGGKFYAILHKFCHRLKKIHEFRINLSIVSRKFVNLAEFCHR